MENYDFNVNTKSLRKAAFAVGVGFTLGKHTAKWLETATCAVFSRWLVNKAKNGDEWAQEICKKAKVDYKGDAKESDFEE